MLADLYSRAYDRTQLAMPAGIRDPALVVQLRLAEDCLRAVTLAWVYAEAHALDAVAFAGLDEVRVQRGGACTRVHLCLEAHDAEVGQGQPFAPAEPQQLAHAVVISVRRPPRARVRVSPAPATARPVRRSVRRSADR